jgi:Cu(I)/Ag(I) efflux system membrane fusion protein
MIALSIAGAAILLLGGGVVGYLVAPRGQAPPPEAPAATESVPTTWTCSMHPQFQLPEPGKCPICFMDLIPLEGDSGADLGPRQLKMSEAAAALAEIQTTPVRRRYARNVVRMVGKVDYDETRLADITARVGGRLDRLFVDYTGVTVREGDHLVSMYSPDLIVAQRELILAKRSAERIAKLDPGFTDSALESAEEKLRLLGLLPEQIEEIKRRGTSTDQLTIHAPTGGIVIEKHANEGTYVKTGTKIYTIADLSTVWVYLDAYESDIPWLRYGQNVEFTTEAYPSETFRGRIAFIGPVLDERTRTVQVRVNVPNPDGKLKPGMFVRAAVESRVAAGGKVFDSSLVGKWISPRHPEVIKDGPGVCDVCGIELVSAEQLGHVLPAVAVEAPLVIPASAPLVTGKRAVVYVRLPGRDQPTFEGREVLLGPRAGDEYIVREGLEVGELVVIQGNFKIDSALQIQAKPSMMTPESGSDDEHAPEPIDVPDEFRLALDTIYDCYLSLQTALADDRLDEARQALDALRPSVVDADTRMLPQRTLRAWEDAVAGIQAALDGDPKTAEMEGLRKRFEPISATLLGLVDAFGHTREAALYRAFCPMAFNNRGAAWLQAEKKIANPYFGHQMLRCGEIQREFPPVAAAVSQDEREEGHDDD